MRVFPLITAHTGCMGTPDNSIRSGIAGLANGADIVEDDIRATKDGVLVLSHDDGVKLADGSEAYLSRSTCLELQEAAGGMPVDGLEELLRLVKESGATVNLDMKSDDALLPLPDLIGRLKMADRVFLTGCGYSRAKLAGQRVPGIRKLLNVDVESFLALPYESAARQACRDARDSGCFGLNVPYRIIGPRLAEIAEDAGLPLYVWTVDEPERMRVCAELGVRSVTTRNVAVLQAVKTNWMRETNG